MMDILVFMRSRWSLLLGISENEIQEDDTFLSLGGKAIHRYQFLYQMEKFLGKRLNTTRFLECETLQELESFLENEVV